MKSCLSFLGQHLKWKANSLLFLVANSSGRPWAAAVCPSCLSSPGITLAALGRAGWLRRAGLLGVAGCPGACVWSGEETSLGLRCKAELFILHRRVHGDLDTKLRISVHWRGKSVRVWDLNLGTFTPLELGGLKWQNVVTKKKAFFSLKLCCH